MRFNETKEYQHHMNMINRDHRDRNDAELERNRREANDDLMENNRRSDVRSMRQARNQELLQHFNEKNDRDDRLQRHKTNYYIHKADQDERAGWSQDHIDSNGEEYNEAHLGGRRHRRSNKAKKSRKFRKSKKSRRSRKHRR